MENEDYKVTVNSKAADNLLAHAFEKGFAVDSYEGCLLDNHIIYDAENIQITLTDSKRRKIQPRKNIILREVYENTWSSAIELIMTDSDKTVDEYIEMFER